MNKQIESKVGIKSYISDHKGFSAIIKQRFSDFIVNEIGSDGEIIHLTSKEVIPEPTAAQPSVNCETQPDELTDEKFELLRLLSGQIPLQQVKPSTFIVKDGVTYVKRNFDEKKFKSVKINVDDVSKERRTVIHTYLKSKFPNLVSNTLDCGSSKCIVVRKRGESNCSRKTLWPASQRFLTFVLYKENIDTIDAVNFIQAKLRMKPNSLAYAGVKDKRAKTSQLLSVYQVAPQNISSAVRRLPKLHVGNFSFRNKPLKLGSLTGNYFQIVLRDAKVEDSALEAPMKSLEENGFINYYGMQRFGSLNLSTHVIGRALLQNDYKKAIDLLFQPKENDTKDILKVKEIWSSTRDASQALKCLKKSKNSIEKQVFTSLAKYGVSNYVTAFQKLPRNVSLMYVHAYQSYIWNCVVSKRIEKYGLKVLPGDLVFNAEYNKKLRDQICTCQTKNELDDHNMLSDCGENLEEASEKNTFLHVLSEEETKLFDITEIVLPIPGVRSKYPNNETKEWYEEFLEKDGISFSNLKLNVKIFQVEGSYRKMVVRVGSLNYSTCYYNDPKLSLIQSDLEAIQNIDVSSNRLESGSYKAVIVKFSLPLSSYATMALRELMKMETSSQFQESLNSTTQTPTSNSRESENKDKDEKIEEIICDTATDKNEESEEISDTTTDKNEEITCDTTTDKNEEIEDIICHTTNDSNKRPNEFEDNIDEKRIKT